ncbi:phosphatidate cytidylyltransferase [Aerococcaceae bacterium DSM 111020]|nr:phosphatidate cytidylyltransferase [Aerococcaceae bacterium DSM 111020]
MKDRLIYGGLAFLVFLPFALVGKIYFAYFLLVLGILGLFELMRMANITSKFPFVIGSFALYAQLMPTHYMPSLLQNLDMASLYFLCAIILLMYTVFKPHKFNFTHAAIIMLGAIYIGRGFYMVVDIRDIGVATLAYFLITVWMTDIFALLVGRKIGKNKLAPQISPSKTVEGMIGGTVGAVIIAALYISIFNTQLGSFHHLILLTIIISLTGQFGDLVESAYKRHFNVKDSGKLIPGHGGVLDRFDSMLFASLAFGIWFNLIN